MMWRSLDLDGSVALLHIMELLCPWKLD